MTDSANDLAPMPRHQHLIVTVYGLYSRAHDGGFAVSDLIRLLGDLSVESAGVRSSVSRLKKRGVLSSVRQGRVAAYKLAEGLEDVFRAGDERIFSRRRAQKDDGWILVSFSVPEAHRHLRHKLRTILTRIGCGQVSPGLWIAPGNLSGEVSQQLDRARLMEYVDLFKAAHLSDDQIRVKVGQWWDLSSLEALYEEFIERYAPVLERWITPDATTDQSTQEKHAFADYVPMVTQWRRLPYLDPGLPEEYLPEGWSGLAAENLFAQLHSILAPLAEKYARSVVGGSWADDSAEHPMRSRRQVLEPT